jgi:hypothetical protein
MRDDTAEHDEAGDHDDIRPATLGADEPREADRAGGAGNVLDDRRLYDARLL